jgi:hypothetical protein
LEGEFDQILKILYETKIVTEQAVKGWGEELASGEDNSEEKSMMSPI